MRFNFTSDFSTELRSGNGSKKGVQPDLPYQRIDLPEPFEAYSELLFMRQGKVRDTWRLKHYAIERNRIRSEFDRIYVSELGHSPSHVVPTTFGIVLQHLGFVYLSVLFNFDPFGEEKIKLWPTEYTYDLKTMVSDENDLFIEADVASLKRIRGNLYQIEGSACVNDAIRIKHTTAFFVMDGAHGVV